MNIKFKRIISLILIGFSFSFLGCEKKQENKTPELNVPTWKVTKDNKTGYLIGTMHLTDPSYTLNTKNMKKIIDESDGLAVELNINSNDVVSKVMDAYFDKNNDPYVNLSEEQKSNLQKVYDKFNISENEVTPYNYIGKYSVISSYIYKEAGLTGPAVDSYLLDNFKSKEIVEIETAESQIEVLKKEYLNEYANLLSDSNMIYINAIESSNKNMFEKYKDNDISAFEDMCTEQKALSIDAYNSLLGNRNPVMFNKAKELYDSGKTYTVAVGLLHLVGEDGLINLLENSGYTVEKL